MLRKITKFKQGISILMTLVMCFSFSATLIMGVMADARAEVEAAAAALSFDDIKGGNAEALYVSANLNLIASFTHEAKGYSVAWSSDKNHVINSAGNVVRPIGANVAVTLTATLTSLEDSSAQASKNIVVTVISRDDSTSTRSDRFTFEAYQAAKTEIVYSSSSGSSPAINEWRKGEDVVTAQGIEAFFVRDPADPDTSPDTYAASNKALMIKRLLYNDGTTYTNLSNERVMKVIAWSKPSGVVAASMKLYTPSYKRFEIELRNSNSNAVACTTTFLDTGLINKMQDDVKYPLNEWFDYTVIYNTETGVYYSYLNSTLLKTSDGADFQTGTATMADVSGVRFNIPRTDAKDVGSEWYIDDIFFRKLTVDSATTLTAVKEAINNAITADTLTQDIEDFDVLKNMYGAQIQWTSSDDEIINPTTGVVTQPTGRDVTVTLSAEITVPDTAPATDTVSFDLVVPAAPTPIGQFTAKTIYEENSATKVIITKSVDIDQSYKLFTILFTQDEFGTFLVNDARINDITQAGFNSGDTIEFTLTTPINIPSGPNTFIRNLIWSDTGTVMPATSAPE